jgi:hypothetical protein
MNGSFSIQRLPDRWEHLGMVMERSGAGGYDSSVTGDPCIVWDERRARYHMFYFGQKHVNGTEHNCNAHAVSASADEVGPGEWQKLGVLEYRNPGDLCGETHKPWILMDPYRPNRAVLLDDEYRLFTVSFRGRNKVIQVASSRSLEGPWTVRPEPVVDIGGEGDFDGYHADAVTAYWFEQRKCILLLYKGYPRTPQPDQPHSPYGSCSAAAVLDPVTMEVQKLGKIQKPSAKKGSWAAGWCGAMQLLRCSGGGWYALMTASSAPPAPVEEEPEMREPAPSLGGWSHTPQEWPVGGWVIQDRPITYLEQLPETARASGETTNLWRHHILVHGESDYYLFYNSGSYGQERMYVRHAPVAPPSDVSRGSAR